MMCSVITTDRTLQIDESYTIKEAIRVASSKGLDVSLRKTFRFYGLKYTEDRAFTSKYKQEFNLSDKKSLYDIQVKELKIYRDTLTGHPVKGY